LENIEKSLDHIRHGHITWRGAVQMGRAKKEATGRNFFKSFVFFVAGTLAHFCPTTAPGTYISWLSLVTGKIFT